MAGALGCTSTCTNECHQSVMLQAQSHPAVKQKHHTSQPKSPRSVREQLYLCTQSVILASRNGDRHTYSLWRLCCSLSVDDKGIKWVSKEGNAMEGYNLTKLRGGGKRIKYDKSEVATKLRKSKSLYKFVSPLPFERFYMIFTWSWFTIYIVSLFTGYADNIFYVISHFYIQRKQNMTNLAETQKIIGPHRIHWPCLFQLQKPALALGGARAEWSGGQDCRGKVKGRGLVERWSL